MNNCDVNLSHKRQWTTRGTEYKTTAERPRERERAEQKEREQVQVEVMMSLQADGCSGGTRRWCSGGFRFESVVVVAAVAG